MTQRSFGRTAFAFAILLALAVVPSTADAQLGRLRKLKNAISPDSAAKAELARQDSITIAARLAVGDSTPIKRSALSRAVKAGTDASAKMERVTGVSAKDAALAASGVGVGGIVAKKLGVDPATVGAKMLGVDPATVKGKLLGKAVAKAASTTAPGALPGPPAASGMPSLADLARQGAKAVQPGNQLMEMAMPGLTAADAAAMLQVQQEMMRLSTAAGNGDAAALARLGQWQTIGLRFNAEIQTLAIAAGAGDMTAIRRLQEIQLLMMREWAGSAKSRKP